MLYVVDEINAFEDLEALWRKSIDQSKYSTVFHTFDWVHSVLKVSSMWKIVMWLDSDGIQFMIPHDQNFHYLGALYTDYTDPFINKDNTIPEITYPTITLPKSKSGVEVSTYVSLSTGLGGIKNKINKDLNRQLKNLDNYKIVFKAGADIFDEFYSSWSSKWDWAQKQSEIFKEFVIGNQALNSATLFVNGEPASLWLYTKHNDKIVCWITARNDTGSLSSGTILLRAVMEHEKDCRYFDSGIGLESYKFNFFPIRRPLFNGHYIFK